ncbi:leucine-rich repeat protein [Sporocytophaga myxococcoides]|uniref:Leucine-rich repeat protein n=1 Tax=Sporocytophaga myxococcoides TaxID=153721 RepID=A0A098LE54_9BACT|nr:T9SS type A sorting domain-containing protein [Sporocytophaga myxococcoides]GAL84448.1 leucine-rich repeat protein [Sporocytophaga myxococcoides]
MQFLKLRKPLTALLLSIAIGNASAQNPGFDPPEGFKNDVPEKETKTGHLLYLKTYYAGCVTKDIENKDVINPDCAKFKDVKSLTIDYKNPMNDLSWVKYFTKLEKLSVRWNYVKTLPDSFPATLKTIDLYSNSISLDEASALKHLPAGLESLSLGNQSVIQAVTVIPPLPSNLKYLELTASNIAALPDSLPSGLTTLWLGSNKIQSANAALANSNVKILNLSYNKLTTITLPSRVTNLYLNNNALENIQVNTTIDSLKEINVSNNKLTNLPTLPSALTSLNAENNLISNLGVLPSNLVNLAVSKNQLTGLPTLPAGLKNLSVSNNLLTVVPSIPLNLEYLYLDSNKITALPALPANLLYLDISYNNINGVLTSLPSSLYYLNISNTNITSFTAPAALNTLNFSKTKVTSFSGALPSGLAELYCENNSLSSIPTLPESLYRIKAKGNLFACLPNFPENLADSDIQLVCNKNCWRVLYGDWNSSSSWSQGTVPTQNDDVLIINGSPNINASNLAVKNLDIRNSVVSGPYSLSVKGDITNSGSFFNYPVIMDGSTASQTIKGKSTSVYYPSLNTYQTNPDIFKHLIIKNPQGIVYKGSDYSLDTLSVLNGFIDANYDTLWINALDECITPVANFVRNGLIGKAQSVTSGWSFVGNPMINQTLATLNASIPLGFGGKNQSIYSYDGKNTSLNHWVAPTGLSSAYTPGTGFRVYSFQSDRIIFAGTPFRGTKDLNVTFDAAGYDNGGWNLVANPYLSPIDWTNADGWTKTNITSGIYIWNPAKSGYASYVNGASTNDGGPTIATGQAFFIKANGANPKLIVNENAKSKQSNSFLRSGFVQPSLKVLLNDKTEELSDELLFRAADGSTGNFDDDFDAYKLPGSVVNISTKSSDGKDLSINSLPDLSGTFPLNITTARTGKFSLSFKNIETLEGTNAYLLDKLLGTEVEISNETDYEFTTNTTETPDRFRVSFTSVVTGSHKSIIESAPLVYPNPAKDQVTLTLGRAKNADVVLINPMGLEIAQWSDVQEGSLQMPLLAESGIYILKVKSNEEIFVYKIVKL